MNTMTSPSSLLAKASGVNSVTGPAWPMASKKLATSALPCRGPYQGADGIAASVDQSMSSVTRSSMAWTSPRPNAWYIILAVSRFCPVLMFCSSPVPGGSGPERGHGRRVADELVDAADPAAVQSEQHQLRAVRRPAVGAGGAEPDENGDAAVAIRQERLRHRA